MSIPALPPASALGPKFILFNGPLFLGAIFDWGLFGIVTIQLYMYYRADFKDAIWLRGSVCTCYILELLQVGFATHCVWYLLILHWGDPAAFAAAPWSSGTFPITGGLGSLIVQVFFAWRIWMLNEHWVAKSISVLIVVLGSMQCLSAIVFGIQSLSVSTVKLATIRSACIVWGVGTATCDILIVGTMLFILHSAKRLAGSEKTASIIDRLMIQTVNSGAVTAMFSFVGLSLFVVFPTNFVFSTTTLFGGKLYSIVLLANLNGRGKDDSSFGTFVEAIDTLADTADATREISASVRGNLVPPDTNQWYNSYGEINIEIRTFRQVHIDEEKPENVV